MTRRILTRETFDHQPGVGDVQGHDPRLRFAAIFNTLSPIVGVSSAKPLVLGGGSVLQPGHYGMGVFNPSNANIGAASSSSDVRFNSTLSDLAVVLAVNYLHGGYTERSITLLNMGGGYYIPSITMESFYGGISGRFAEGYSGVNLSGSCAKGIPGVVMFRRVGTALTIECLTAAGTYTRSATTDTKRSVPELGAGGVSIGGGNAVAAAYIIEGTVDDDEARALLSNPWRVFKGRRLFVGGWASGGGGSSSDLTIQDASHAHTSDSPVLVAQSTLVVADASHAHAADSLTLATLSVLSVADASHAHAADNLTLSTGLVVDLTIQDSAHGHSADSLNLAAQSFLAIADASHAHAADNLTLSTGLVVDLTIQDSTHAHTSDTPALAAQSFLQILDASHGHTSDALTLMTLSVLSIADASHAHAADSLTLATQSTLVVADASHGHSADSLNLAAQSFLAIADTSHGHAADNLTLSPVLVVDLTIQDSTHAHTSDTAFLTTILPTSKPGYIADDTYRSFSSDDPLRVFATDDLAGGMHMAHRFPSIEVEEKVPLTFRFGAELVDQGATLASISSVAVAVRNGVADASPSSLVTISSISGTNVVAAVDGRTAGADFELRVTCATSNPYLVLTRVGYLQVNG